MKALCSMFSILLAMGPFIYVQCLSDVTEENSYMTYTDPPPYNTKVKVKPGKVSRIEVTDD